MFECAEWEYFGRSNSEIGVSPPPARRHISFLSLKYLPALLPSTNPQLRATMAEDGPPSGSTTPLAHVTRTPLDADHAPVVSSPLNPDSTRARPSKAPQREQREKKESLKKRENADTRTRGGTPDVKVKKHKGPTVPLPMRYIIPEPKASDYDLPRDQQWQSHEPTPFFSPGGEQELRRPIEQLV